MKETCCPICYKVGGSGNFPGASENDNSKDLQRMKMKEVQQRFFKLLERYLNFEDWLKCRKLFPFPLQKFAEIGMLSCGDCFRVMESFCELFHQLKTIELNLDWHVQKLKNVMMASQRVTTRMKHFREFIWNAEVEESGGGWKGPAETMGLVVKSKKLLIAKCSEIESSSFPKLEIPKCDSDAVTDDITQPALPTMLFQLSQSIITGEAEPDSTSNVDCEDDEGSPISSTIDRNALIKNISLIPESNEEGTDAFSPEPPDAVVDATTQPVLGPLSQLSQSAGTEEEVESDPVSNVHCEDDEGSPVSLAAIDPSALTESISLILESNEERADIYGGSFSPETLPTIQEESDPATKNSPPVNSSQPDAPISDIDPSTSSPIDTPEETNLTENSGQKFGLRAKHGCEHCHKSFSSLEILQSHVREAHQDESEHDLLSQSDNEDDDASDNDDNVSLSSSSSDDEDSLDMDADSQPKANKKKNQKSKCLDTSDNVSENSSIIPLKFREVVVTQQTSLRLKCPDCSELFLSFKAFLIHREDSESCKPFYDPTTSVKVEVLSRPINYKETGDNDADKNSFDLVALIDLPQTIFICVGCGLALYSSEDLDKHKELHGSFSCQFCKFKCSYAPALSRHEFQHSVRKMSFEDTGHALPCPRCDVKFKNIHDKAAHIQHHLKEHLSVNLHEPSCAICKTTYKKLGLLDLVDHLKSHHDLTNNNNPERCSMDNCKAYYLTKEQLQEHLKICHDYVHVEEKKGDRKCRDCGELFQGLLFLREHQLMHHTKSSADSVIKCPHAKCPRLFDSKKSLEVHMKKHRPSFSADIKKLKCPDCNNLFSEVKGLLLHRKDLVAPGECEANYDPTTSIKVEVVITPNDEANVEELQEKSIFAVVDLPQEIYICEECGREVFSLEDKEAHSKLHGTFKCNFCPVERTYAPDIAKHERTHIKRRAYGSGCNDFMRKCPQCDFKCNERMTYTRHHLETHMSLTFKETNCPICKTTSSVSRTRFNLAQHLKKYHDVTVPNGGERSAKIKRCTVTNCSSYFLTNMQLDHHLRMHHGSSMKSEKNKYKCEDCEKCYNQQHTLRAHRLQCHVDSDKVIPCVFENCSKVFESRMELINHISAASSLSYHKPLDDPYPGKMIQCPTCEASFIANDPKFLVEHVQLKHGAEKPRHVCELCGKDFRLIGQLDRHYLTHSGPKSWKFECNVCSKKCVNKGKLNEHMRTHTKDKHFVCQVCGQAYAHRHNLRIHVNNKHGDLVQDIPRKFSKYNSGSRKGVKRKQVQVEAKEESSSDSDTV